MRSAAILLASVVMTGAIPSARAGSDDVDQIGALEERLAAAAEARNLDNVMKAYSPDDTLFVFDVSPPRRYVGAKAWRKGWEGLFAGIKGPLKYTIADAKITVVGTVAYGHSIQRIVATGIKGDPVDLTTRVTDVYRKVNGNWMIVQEHISVPVDLDTGKPDLTSAP
jgi:ketosteroid isomerase-like protein